MTLRYFQPFESGFIESPATSTKFESSSQFPPSELPKARQLKEYKKLNGLCFKCGEKFNPGHKCKQLANPWLNFIAVEDGGDDGASCLMIF